MLSLTYNVSARYSTYVLMDQETNKIVALSVTDKREVGLKSPNMEKEGLKKCLNMCDKLHVSEITTDAHTQIAAFLCK